MKPNEIIKKNNDDKCLVLFKSIEQFINYPIVCKNTDIFSDLEEKLYLVFPEIKHKNINFFANGNLIEKSATLEENKIKNDTTILIDGIGEENYE